VVVAAAVVEGELVVAGELVVSVAGVEQPIKTRIITVKRTWTWEVRVRKLTLVNS
jgi:hypothetical protein